MNYFKQLDSLRFLAVFIVIFHHLPILPEGSLIGCLFEGITGVDVFFCLSGFLITGILLKANEHENSNTSKLTTFYIRRFFRIFPIYYLSIFILILINPMHYREYCWVDLLYVSNIKMGLSGDFSSVTPHFWSLAVEEQFYLIWPFLIFFFPKKGILSILLLFLGLGITFKFYFLGTTNDFLITRTVGNLVYLSSGGILAYFFHKNKSHLLLSAKSFPPILTIYVASQIAENYFEIQLNPYLKLLINYTLSFTMVAAFANGFNGITGKIMSFRPLLFLGKISYGLYVYHMLMVIPLVAMNKFSLRYFQFNLTEHLALANGIKIIFTIIVATISWYWIEKPINKLKDKFRYQ